VSIRISRRRFIQASLGAGAGLALWDLYRLGIRDKSSRDRLSYDAFASAELGDYDLYQLLATALNKGGEYADVFLERRITTTAIFDDDNVEGFSVDYSGGGGIRVLSNGASNLRVTDELTWEALLNTARAASDGASGPGAKPSNLKELEIESLYPAASSHSADVLEEQQAIARRITESARKTDGAIQRVRTVCVCGMRFITVAASTGVVARDSQPDLKITVQAFAVEQESGKSGAGVFNGGGKYGFEYFASHPVETFGRRAAEIARHQIEGKEAPAGDFPLVLGPGYSGVLLHEAVGHGLEADSTANGLSVYANRLGESIASPLCTVYDDGRRPYLNGTINFDDEGVPSSQAVLIENGKLAGYMHSRQTATRMGVKPTGNGRRQAFNFPPLPRMTNTYLAAGSDDPEDIIRSVEYGIYASNFSGGTANIYNGDFVFFPTEAFLIESGKITAPLSNILLAGNGPDVLKRVTRVGHDIEISDDLWSCGKEGQFVPVTVGTPTIKVDSITVGGTLNR
jgi:TldD protein